MLRKVIQPTTLITSAARGADGRERQSDALWKECCHLKTIVALRLEADVSVLPYRKADFALRFCGVCDAFLFGKPVVGGWVMAWETGRPDCTGLAKYLGMRDVHDRGEP